MKKSILMAALLGFSLSMLNAGTIEKVTSKVKTSKVKTKKVTSKVKASKVKRKNFDVYIPDIVNVPYGVKGPRLVIGTDLNSWTIKDKVLDVEFMDTLYMPGFQPLKPVMFRLGFGYGLLTDYVEGRDGVASSKADRAACPATACPVVDNSTPTPTKVPEVTTQVTAPASNAVSNSSDVLSSTATTTSDSYFRFRPYVQIEPSVEWKGLQYGMLFGIGYALGSNSDEMVEETFGLAGTRLAYTFDNQLGVSLKYLHTEGFKTNIGEDKTILGFIKQF